MKALKEADKNGTVVGADTKSERKVMMFITRYKLILHNVTNLNAYTTLDNGGLFFC